MNQIKSYKKDSPFHSYFSHHSVRLSLLGALLGLGSPLGLLAIRYFRAFETQILSWLKVEMTVLGWIYLYTGIGTILVFALLGFWAGSHTDRLEGLTSDLKKTSKELKNLSITDSLTGVYIRRYLLERLKEELVRANRYHYPVSSLFIDIDNFKSINDQHGHLSGDHALVEVAQIIQANTRLTDLTGRYGGDEFFVAMPHANEEQAYNVAERIRENVQKVLIRDAEHYIKVTVSIGITCTSKLPVPYTDYINAADRALHQSKEKGKNRTAVYHLSPEDRRERKK